MKMQDWLRVLVAAICTLLTACGTHRSQPEPSPINNLSYIDLQPGWRIRVVAPILKSGGYKVQLQEVRNQNGTITMKTGKDFEGYETDYYDVRVTDGLLKISFRSGDVRFTAQPCSSLGFTVRSANERAICTFVIPHAKQRSGP